MTEKMKPSDSHEIALPDGWESARFRKLFSFGKGLGITKDDLVEEGVPVISYGQVHSKVNTGTAINESLIRFVPESYLRTDKQALTQEGNFIFADTSEDLAGVGNCVFVDTSETLFAGYHSIIARPKEANIYPKFFAYQFLTDCWRDQIRSKVMGVKVFSISQKLLRDTTVLIPPKPEQRAIAGFLDVQCAQIDSVIADIEKQIETLQKYKKSLITEVITDKNDCWKYGRVKDLMTLQRGHDLAQEEFVVGNIPVYGSNGVIGHHNVATTKGPNITIGRSGSVGALNYVECDFWAHNTAIFVSNDKGNYMRYLYYILRSFDVKELANGSAVPTLDRKKVEGVHLFFTLDREEQKRIADYLDERIAKIDGIVDVKQTQLATIRQHKKSLIYEYVTGKKRVTEVN